MFTSQDVMDQFAGQAMQAILTNQQLLTAVTGTTLQGADLLERPEVLAAISKRAYDVACAMLTERGQRMRLMAEFTFKPDDKLRKLK